MSPFFSIIIPCLNEAKRLPLLLRDLSKQSFTDFEVIVVDGQSDDETYKKALSFKKTIPSLSTFSVKKRNVCYQRNFGASNAQSEWLLFLDADDRLPSYFLQGLKYRLESEPADIFTTHFEADSLLTPDVAMAKIANLYFDMLKSSKRPTLFESCFGIRRSAFNQVKGFPEKVKVGEGAALVQTAIKKGCTFSVYKDPVYTFSFRRFKNKSLLTAPIGAGIELARLLNISFEDKAIEKLYPMKGGTYHDRQNFIDKLISEFTRDLKSDSPISLKKYQQKIKNELANLFK